MSVILNEHYRYLRLGNRTEAYRKALREVMRKGDSVADLGCGFAILGMLAIEEGASHCFAIDETAAIEVARETMRRKGMADRFTFLRSSTFDAKLPDRVDVLVCDHIGFFGFDYGIVPMLADARKRFLKPGGTIVPRSMNIGVALASSTELQSTVNRWESPAIPDAYRWLGEQETNAVHSHRFAASDLLSEPKAMAYVDFLDDPPDLISFASDLTCVNDGEVDGLCGFFDCALSDSVTVTNDPLASEPLGRSNGFLPFQEPFRAKAGDTVGIDVKIRHDPQIINWTITPPGDAPKQSMSTWKSRILSPDQFANSDI